MDSRHITRKKNRRILVRLRKILRTKIFVYFLCVLFSFGVWISISLSQQRTESMEFEVQYIHHPENYTLINQPQHTIYLSIESSGYELQDLNKNKDRILDLDVSMISLKNINNQYVGVLKSNDIISDLYAQLMLKGTIKQMMPDSILLIYEKNSSKEIPVVLDADYQLMEQFWESSTPVITPKTITISGFATDLDSISVIKTAYQNFGYLSDTLHTSLALMLPKTQYPIISSHNSVSLSIPIEQFTEKTFTIPVEAKIANQKYKLKTFPNTITVSCLVSLKNFNQIVDTMFKAQVIYDEAIDKESILLPVQIINTSNVAKVSKINPEKVEYILIQQ